METLCSIFKVIHGVDGEDWIKHVFYFCHMNLTTEQLKKYVHKNDWDAVIIVDRLELEEIEGYLRATKCSCGICKYMFPNGQATNCSCESCSQNTSE